MLIWALFAAMTAVAALIVLAALARRSPADAPSTDAGDVSVYRDQLAEIDRDLAAGLVAPSEAEAARAEIARRLIRAARTTDPSTEKRGTGRSRLVAALVVVLIPAVTVGTYLRLGHPDVPDAPLLARKAEPAGQSIDGLLAKVEAHLAEAPNDLRGWEVIVPVYMRMGRVEDAVQAIRQTIRIGGSTAKRQIALGEALVAAADGNIGEAARTAFEEALRIEPESVLPRMYLAAAMAQDGRLREAAGAWAAIVASGTEGDAWLPVARDELAKAEAAAGLPPSAPAAPTAAPSAPAAPTAAPSAPAAPKPAPGPSKADMDAAAAMDPADRSAMISDMVARLDERLKTGGGSIEDWERLVKSLKVLGRLDDARAALTRARTALASDAAAAKRLDALAEGL